MVGVSRRPIRLKGSMYQRISKIFISPESCNDFGILELLQVGLESQKIPLFFGSKPRKKRRKSGPGELSSEVHLFFFPFDHFLLRNYVRHLFLWPFKKEWLYPLVLKALNKLLGASSTSLGSVQIL